MDTPKPTKPGHLLDDLETIRQLLENDGLEPPLLTEQLDDDVQIPLLDDVIEPGPSAPNPPAPLPAPPAASTPAPVRPAPPAQAATPDISESLQRSLNAQGVGELRRLDGELRSAAQLILQDVIDDFVPQIEAELRRRLDARLDRLIAQRRN
ncbi:DNA polymerase III subunit chi [Pseudomonas sp. LRF_L74]|uniref:DNA polymerase III subunit chi n=1 Tax=Pseudomonas sp. LRF_L74 TaxID=3369422 RepID=UPI003F62DF97